MIPVSELPKPAGYQAGFGLALQGTRFLANPQALQLRVSQLCPDGQAIRAIKIDGTITCQAIVAGGGGDVTAVQTAAGSGLTGGGATGDLTLGTDFDTIQKRIAGCPASQFVTAVAVSGVPTCAVVVQSITAGTGITKTGTASAPIITADTAYLQRRIATACPAGQAIRSADAAGAPTCQGTGTGTITGITAGTGLTGGGTTGNVTLNLAVPLELAASVQSKALAVFNNTDPYKSSGVVGVGSQNGVLGSSTGNFEGKGVGGFASGSGGAGVSGGTDGGRCGVCADASTGAALDARGRGVPAGVFYGDVEITGTLTKGAGSFKIDDPLDPANRYLQHSFVESPEMKNVYDGVTVTDARGYATVKLAPYFQALNRTFRYQLTTIRSFARAIVWREVSHNSFVIRTNDPRVKVSWQVTGVRQDAYARKHPIVVSTAKAQADRGHYLTPDAFGKDARLGIGYRAPQATP